MMLVPMEEAEKGEAKLERENEEKGIIARTL
jgi:hypothetical protein